MNGPRFPAIVALAALYSLFVSCSGIQVAGGTDTETGGTVVMGSVRKSDGAPAPNTLVSLIPADYNPAVDPPLPDSLTAMTNAGGFYTVHVPVKGSYDIQAVNQALHSRLLLYGIECNDSVVFAPAAALSAPGAIRLSLPGALNTANGYYYIPGTAIFITLQGKTDFAVMDSVPAGIVPLIVYASFNNSTAPHVRYSVPVNSYETANVYNPDWKYARTISFNTTTSGAGVTGDVTDFPVLVRLNTGNFDFSQAKSTGADIRFTKPDGAYLSYEIERWDSINSQAEIWVKADTIRGNDSAQAITMYWGNPDASNSSNSTKVFDTAAGFQGVWHLDESSGNIGDATINRFNGARNGNQARVGGEIGYAQGYDGSGDYTDMGNVCSPGASSFTVCSWIKLSTTKQYQAIVSKSKGDFPSSSYGWLVEIGPDGALVVFMATDTGTWGGPQTFVLASRVFITDTVAWHHVAVVVDPTDNNNCKLFIDGSQITSLSVSGDITGVGAVVNSAPLRLGSDAKGGCQLKGSLDECSISRTVRSADWVKLCYMNQKTDDKLVFVRINQDK